MQDIKQQLAPGWSTVNVIIMVILFTLSWPMAVLFLAYILWGNKVGLDLSRPETLRVFAGRIKNAFRAAIEAFSKG